MMEWKEGVSQKGNKTMKVAVTTPYRQFTVWLMPDAKHLKGMGQWDTFRRATQDMTVQPQTVTYRKDPATNFFEIRAYNREPDHAPE